MKQKQIRVSASTMNDYSIYPRFSTIESFITYLVDEKADPRRADALEAYRDATDAMVCDVCKKKAKYIRLAMSAQFCSFASLSIHRVFCSKDCYEYYYVVKKLGGTP